MVKRIKNTFNPTNVLVLYIAHKTRDDDTCDGEFGCHNLCILAHVHDECAQNFGSRYPKNLDLSNILARSSIVDGRGLVTPSSNRTPTPSMLPEREISRLGCRPR